MKYVFNIPLRPPSVNTYWRRGQHTTYLSKTGREFKNQATKIFKTQFCEEKPLLDRLKMKIYLNFKDGRKRDIDNYNKAILDSMNKIVFEDDEQIEDLRTIRKYKSEKDEIIIELEQIEKTNKLF